MTVYKSRFGVLNKQICVDFLIFHHYKWVHTWFLVRLMLFDQFSFVCSVLYDILFLFAFFLLDIVLPVLPCLSYDYLCDVLNLFSSTSQEYKISINTDSYVTRTKSEVSYYLKPGNIYIWLEHIINFILVYEPLLIMNIIIHIYR